MGHGNGSVRAARLLVVLAGLGMGAAPPSDPGSASLPPAITPSATVGEASGPPGADTLPEAEPLTRPPGTLSQRERVGFGAQEGTQLVPGQRIEPIDLGSALRLAGARDLDIAIARER